MALTDMTPEQRETARQKGAAKLANLIATAGELKQDWLDAEIWEDYARERGVTLPAKHLRPEPHLIRRHLRKLNISGREFLEWGGYAKLEDFMRLNPRWPLRALVGVLLEYAVERDQVRETLREKLKGADND